MRRASTGLLRFLLAMATLVVGWVLLLYLGAAVTHLMLEVVVAGWESVS